MRPTILVIEHDPDLARLFESILTIEGYRVWIDPHIEAASKTLAHTTPDLIVYDWSSTQPIDYLWFDATRTAQEQANVPMVLVCDELPPRAIRNLLSDMGIPIIEKPFELARFCRTLEALMPMRERVIGGW
jgi:DNA-binding response OmpR family regulator